MPAVECLTDTRRRAAQSCPHIFDVINSRSRLELNKATQREQTAREVRPASQILKQRLRNQTVKVPGHLGGDRTWDAAL